MEDKKEKQLRKYLIDEPENIEHWLRLGRYYIETYNIEKAIHHLEAAQKKFSNPEICSMLAKAYKLVGQEEKAIFSYLRCLSLNPQDYKCIIGLGKLYLEMGLYDDAERVISDANKFYPEKIEPYILLAKLYLEKRDYQRALYLAKIGYDLAKSNNTPTHKNIALAESSLILGKILYALGDISAARYYIELTLKIVPSNIAAREILNRIYSSISNK